MKHNKSFMAQRKLLLLMNKNQNTCCTGFGSFNLGHLCISYLIWYNTFFSNFNTKKSRDGLSFQYAPVNFSAKPSSVREGGAQHADELGTASISKGAVLK